MAEVPETLLEKACKKLESVAELPEEPPSELTRLSKLLCKELMLESDEFDVDEPEAEEETFWIRLCRSACILGW